MFSSNKSCQSCGLPWDKDPNGGGSNADGSLSEVYCSYCWQNGVFVQPDWTAKDMQEYALKILSRKGVPEFLGKMLVKDIPKLQRWSK
jgi:hypothetical protein